MDEAVAFSWGDTIEFVGQWTNEDGSPIDLTGCTPSVSEASHPVLQEYGAVTITTAATGWFRFRLPNSQRMTLEKGTSAWLRILLTLPSGDFDASDPIRIKIV